MPGNSNSEEAYKARAGFDVSVTKTKIRGKGRSLSLRYTSVDGKDFDLLGWGIWCSKAQEP